MKRFWFLASFSMLLAVVGGGITRDASAAREVVSGPAFKYAIDTAVPAWIKPVATPLSVPSQRAPWHYALRDNQVRVSARSVDRHTHVVRRLVEPSALSEASQILITFDPSFQTLTIHDLALVRGAQRINKLSKNRIRLMQREKNLEQQVYEGIITVTAVIDDARVGDSIEYRYTVSGSNPVFENRFHDVEGIRSYGAPAALVYARILHPKDRQVRLQVLDKGYEIRETTGPAEKEIVIEAKDVSMIEAGSDLPPDHYLKDWVGFSEHLDWQSVADWGTRTFAKALVGSSRIMEQAATLRVPGGKPTDQVVRALDFVQRDIRYFGVEIGPYSHLPNAADKVLSQRFGDCKDKSVLLIALLQELGITAYPVLVSSRDRRFVRDYAPSPYAFNHAIVGVEVDGRTFWLDPTRRYESGPLEQRQASEFGAGLPLRAGVRELAAAPQNPVAPLLGEYRDEIMVKGFAEPAALAARITFNAGPAQYMLTVWNSPQRAEFEKQFVAEYARRYSGARQVGNFRMIEDTERSAARIEMDFEIQEPFEYVDDTLLAGNVFMWGILSELRPGFNSARTQPLYLGDRRRVTHTVVFRLPEQVTRDPQDFSSRVDDPHFLLQHKIIHDARTVTFQLDLETRSDVVPIDRWQQFHKNALEAANRTANHLRFSPIPIAKGPEVTRRLQEMDRQFATGRSSWITPVQVRAEARRLVLSEHLESGRLSSKHRARALMARAVANEQTNRLDEAMRDATLALSTAPPTTDSLGQMAVTLWNRGEFDKSLEAAAKHLEKAPNDAGTLSVIGRSYFHLGKYDEAARHFLDATRNSSGDGKYFAVAWAILAEKRARGTAAKVAQDFQLLDSDDRFVHQIVRFLTGKISEGDLLEKAKNRSRPVQISQECEAYFYIGMHHLIAGDLQSARTNLERSVGTKVYEFIEYAASKFELTRINSSAPR